ncbi:MAG: GNAT family N-acetyltransferase [Candidatus Eisenbacteria bacterium]|nr:GNAT family N-acetyltransferase [Candidatus Eisenbacteria bacterium]
MIEYRSTVEGITPEQLAGFFEGWPMPPTPETHRRILAASDRVELAVDAASGVVVGFVTAISDGILSAYIPLLEVRRDYRRRGIGRELMRRILARLGDLYMVDLICDAERRPFYRALGMRDAAGMMIRNWDRQSGT